MARYANKIIEELKKGGSDPVYKFISVGGAINVVKDYRWAVFDGKKTTNTIRVPKITLTEYQPIGSQTVAVVEKFIKNAYDTINDRNVSNFLDAYKGLYNAIPTNNTYIFPYFNENLRNKSSSWAKNADIENAVQAVLPSKFSQLLKTGTETVVGGNLGIEYPKSWQGTDSAASYSFEFYIHNTINVQDTLENWALVTLLSHNNSYNRRNLAVQDAPVLYKVEIPGIRFSPLSAVKSLRIDMEGQVRQYTFKELGVDIGSENDSIILPEAYKLTFDMEDLFIESRQLLPGSIGYNRIEVVSQSNITDFVQEIPNTITNGFQNLFRNSQNNIQPPFAQ